VFLEQGGPEPILPKQFSREHCHKSEGHIYGKLPVTLKYKDKLPGRFSLDQSSGGEGVVFILTMGL